MSNKQHKSDHDENELIELRRSTLIQDILSGKRERFQFGRGDGRYLDIEDDGKSATNRNVNFVAIADAVGVDEEMLSEGLSEYKEDRDRLIGALIEVVYAENPREHSMWSTLKADDERKMNIFRGALFGHFECTQLSTANLLKLSKVVVERKALQIDIEALNEMVTSNKIDGRMFDKTDSVRFQNMGGFAKRFKSVPDCKQQHVGRLYGALRKWKYVEMKAVEKEAVNDGVEEVDDGKEDESLPTVWSLCWISRRSSMPSLLFASLQMVFLQPHLTCVAIISHFH